MLQMSVASLGSYCLLLGTAWGFSIDRIGTSLAIYVEQIAPNNKTSAFFSLNKSFPYVFGFRQTQRAHPKTTTLA